MTGTYSIEATRFAEILRDQREMRLKGGIYHLTQIQMAYNSGQLAGIQLTEEQVRYIYETRTLIGEASVNDIVETDNHFRTLGAVLDHIGQPVTPLTLKSYHRELKHGSADSRTAWSVVGNWKSTTTNRPRPWATTPPDEIDEAITRLIARTPAITRFEDIVDWHAAFARIHPFHDGNGRIGRLMMLEQCLTHGVMPFIVPAHRSTDYYRGIAQYDTDPAPLQNMLRHLQDMYYQRFESFIPRR